MTKEEIFETYLNERFDEGVVKIHREKFISIYYIPCVIADMEKVLMVTIENGNLFNLIRGRLLNKVVMSVEERKYMLSTIANLNSEVFSIKYTLDDKNQLDFTTVYLASDREFSISTLMQFIGESLTHATSAYEVFLNVLNK